MKNNANPECNLCRGTGVTGGHDGLLEFECCCLDENEPQLSAEMEKRFDEEVSRYINTILVGLYDKNGVNIGFKSSKDVIKHFLATALEEQRAEYAEWVNKKITQCERLKDSEYLNDSPDYFRGKIAILNDILAILEGK